MRHGTKRRTWLVLGLSATLVGGVIASSATAAQAAPRYRAHDWDRDGIRNDRDWDRDGDGIPNFRDRHPNRPDAYRYYVPRTERLSDRERDWIRERAWYQDQAWDRDRDGIPNFRDRDRDGDGVPDWRDRHPNDRRRR